jgi:hypothetical protein
MVIEPFVRMGPPPRSLAAEANDCFMVRLPRGANRIQGCGAIFARYGGLPSDRWRTARPQRFNRGTERPDRQRTPWGMGQYNSVT